MFFNKYKLFFIIFLINAFANCYEKTYEQNKKTKGLTKGGTHAALTSQSQPHADTKLIHPAQL